MGNFETFSRGEEKEQGVIMKFKINSKKTRKPTFNVGISCSMYWLKNKFFLTLVVPKIFVTGLSTLSNDIQS